MRKTEKTEKKEEQKTTEAQAQPDQQGHSKHTSNEENPESKAGMDEGPAVAVETKPEPPAEDKLKELQDKYLRLSAEFDNYRKRTLREKTDLIKYAGNEIIIRLLPIMDDFERALKALQETSEPEAVKQGIELIYNKFRDFLSGQGVNEIDALNKEFSTDFHEAVSASPASDESLKGKCIDVVLKGYTLYDKVIRHAKVVVGE